MAGELVKIRDGQPPLSATATAARTDSTTAGTAKTVSKKLSAGLPRRFDFSATPGLHGITQTVHRGAADDDEADSGSHAWDFEYYRNR